MKDEEIKLPPVPSLVTETDWHQAFINYGREAVRLNQPQAEPLPFNLESAKRGEIVIHGGKEKRWIGLSSIEEGLNIVESSSGVGYAADCDLFMKPKPMRTAYVCVYKSGKLEIFEDLQTAGQHAIQYGISVFKVQIPDLR